MRPEELRSDPSGVGGDGGSCKAYRVTENSGGGRQGVGEGDEYPQGIDTPGVEALPPGNETPIVDTEGNGVMGEDR